MKKFVMFFALGFVFNAIKLLSSEVSVSTEVCDKPGIGETVLPVREQGGHGNSFSVESGVNARNPEDTPGARHKERNCCDCLQRLMWYCCGCSEPEDLKEMRLEREETIRIRFHTQRHGTGCR